MGKSYRFNLDNAVVAWRRSLEYNRTFLPEDLDELEQHLRDQIADLVAGGHEEQAAFRLALSEMGVLSDAETEYRKTYWGKRWRHGETMKELLWELALLRNYLRVVLRDVRKHKGYTFINVSGLAIGLMCFALIGLFVRFELSYDTFHEKVDRIYRIARDTPNHPILGVSKWAQTPPPLLPVLLEEFPQVEHATQIMKANALLERGEKRFYEDGVFATRQFFDVFSFRLIAGDPGAALADPTSIILTESLARKYFGDANPVGKTISVTYVAYQPLATNEMRVAAVLEDPPANSHFSFDYLVPVSSSSVLAQHLDDWGGDIFYTYAVLRPDYALSQFEERLTVSTKKHLGQARYFKNHPEYVNNFFVQPLTDIHLQSHFNREIGVNGDVRYVYVFSAIGLLILLLACVNYTNLTAARAVTRTLEVGIRKVMGARRKQLIAQFMGEAVVPTLVALVVAGILTAGLLPFLSTLTGRQLQIDFVHDGRFLALLVLIGITCGILAGSYPALFMSSFRSVSMLRGQRAAGGNMTLRNGLVVFQFAVTFVLIVGALVVHRQLQFVRSTDTGINRSLVLSIDIRDPVFYKRYSAFKQTLTSHANVFAVTASEQDPTLMTRAGYVESWDGEVGEQTALVYRSYVQYDFVDLLDIELLDGRDFSESVATDLDEGALVNEALMRRFGWESALGKRFTFNHREHQVIGVMKDFNFNSFRMEVEPFALFLDSERPNPMFSPESFNHVLVKVGPEDVQQTISTIDETMTEFSPGYPFEYHFLDEAYDEMYRTEIRLGGLFGYFTALALFIACLGLLGLAAFTVSQRTKEIGIRKVLGASVRNVTTLLSTDFLKLVGIAFVLGVPPAYLAAHRWLEGFAYRIEMGIGVFVLAGAIVFVITILTVSFRAIDAALADPVNSLRYE